MAIPRQICLTQMHLTVELSDACDMYCCMCAHARTQDVHGQTHTNLSVDQVVALAHSLQESHVVLESLTLSWLGESLLHEKFTVILAFLLKENERLPFFAGLVIQTNGRNLSDDSIDLLLRCARQLEDRGGFFHVYFNLDAANEDTYSRIKNVPSHVFHDVVGNIERVLEKRAAHNLRMPSCIYTFVVVAENSHEIEAFIKKINALPYYKGREDVPVMDSAISPSCGDAILLRREECVAQEEADALFEQVTGFNDSCEKRDTLREGAVSLRRPCRSLWYGGTVSAQGVVVPCCCDSLLTMPLGNIATETFDAIWHGDAITRMRLDHIKGAFYKYALCNTCAYGKSHGMTDSEIVRYLCALHSPVERLLYETRMEIDVDDACGAGSDTLHVCIVSREYPPETAWGGIGTYTHTLAHGLADAGHRVHVITEGLTGDAEYYDKDVHVLRVQLWEFLDGFDHSGTGKRMLEYSNRVNDVLHALMQKYPIDIIEGPSFAAETYVYSVHKKIPLVTRVHSTSREVRHFISDSQPADSMVSWMENALIRNSDMVTCSTQAHWDFTQEYEKVFLGDAAIIPLGISVPKIKKPKRPANDKIRILFVGRLEKRKGVAVLVDAMQEVLARSPRVVCTIVGRDTYMGDGCVSFSGDEKDSYKKKMRMRISAQHQKHIHFLEYVSAERLQQLYQACDIFVAPSLYESFCLVNIEAMAYGKPVVSTRVGGIPEVVEDGVTGILVEPGDVDALADALVMLVEDSPLRATLGTHAREAVEQKFSRDIFIRNTIQAYRDVIGDSSRTVPMAKRCS